MAHEVLGQVAPAATTDTDFYTVHSAKNAICSTLSICNATGESLAPINNTIFLTLGIRLDATNMYLLISDSANSLSVSVFGIENS